MQKLYQRLYRITINVVTEQQNELTKLELEYVEKRPKFVKNDLVKINVVQRLGDRNKTFKSYPMRTYRVLWVLPFAKSLLIEPTGQSELQKRTRMRIHMRHVKFVGSYKGQDKSENDYLLTDNCESKTKQNSFSRKYEKNIIDESCCSRFANEEKSQLF